MLSRIVNSMANKSQEGSVKFPGFLRPERNYFMMPNEWIDMTAGMKLAELKVIEYVLRHTWGFQEYGIKKRISINEFMQGRKRAGSERMDKGTGLSNRSVIDGLRAAIEHGYLVEETDDSDRGRIKKFYALNMRELQNLQPDVKNSHRGVKNPHSRSEETSYRTKKETSERNNTVNNGHQTSPLRRLPDLDEPQEKVSAIAADILDSMGDSHSKKFYLLVAAKVPEQIIREALAEIKADGAKQPARVFTYRMNRYALLQLQRAG